MTFILSNKKFEKSKKIGDLYYKGEDIYFNNNNLFYFKGTLLPKDLNSKEAFKELSKKKFNLNQFNKKFDGAYYFTKYNIKDNKIKIGIDRLAQEFLYYYIDENLIIITNDYWEAIKIIKPEPIEINWQYIKEVSRYGYKFYDTMVKKLMFLGPAQIIIINTQFL